MLRRTTTFAAALATCAAPVFAGSITPVEPEPTPMVPAAPIAPSSPNWTGAYAGGQLGFADIDTNAAGTDGDGYIGGLTAGYDYDLGDWVVGGGLDYDFADINIGGGTTVDSIWRAKLRGGYKIGNGLLYAAGGYAGADTNNLGNEGGYFIGGGYDHMVSQNFSMGGEVLYHEIDGFGPAPSVDLETTTIQVRGTFRF